MISYAYIIESESSGKWYYGFTEDLDQRIKDHQSNRSKYTRFKGPWKLIFKREFLDKTEALRFEKHLKTIRNKEFIKEKFKDYFIFH
jgi:putative endonuclease